MSEKETGTQDAGKTEAESEAKVENADTGGAEAKAESETGGSTDAKPIMTEEEKSAWKEATRKEMVKEVTKSVKAELQREADAKAATEAGDWKTVAEKAQEENAELKRQLAERDQKDLVARIAAAHKLPADLADMLKGETEAELTESAKLLAKHIKPVKAPDTEGGVNAGTTNSDTRQAPRHDDNRKKEPAYTFEGRKKVPWGGNRAAAAQQGVASS